MGILEIPVCFKSITFTKIAHQENKNWKFWIYGKSKLNRQSYKYIDRLQDEKINI